MNKINKYRWLVPVFLLLFNFSCESLKKTEDESSPSRLTSTIRLEDIERRIQENPVAAINLIFIFKEV